MIKLVHIPCLKIYNCYKYRLYESRSTEWYDYFMIGFILKYAMIYITETDKEITDILWWGPWLMIFAGHYKDTQGLRILLVNSWFYIQANRGVLPNSPVMQLYFTCAMLSWRDCIWSILCQVFGWGQWWWLFFIRNEIIFAYL